MKKREVIQVKTVEETKKVLYAIVNGWQVKTIDQLAKETGVSDEKVRAWAYQMKACMRKKGMEADNYLPQRKGTYGVAKQAIEQVCEELKTRGK